MSGGSYDYAYFHIDELARAIRTEGPAMPGVDYELRSQFKRVLSRAAEAARAIEWNDSGDGDRNEAEKIMCVLFEALELERDR